MTRDHLPIKDVFCKACGVQHLATRVGSTCPACRREYNINWFRANTEYYRARYNANQERERERKRKYRAAHKRDAAEYVKQYHAQRPGLKNLWDANRRAAEKRAMPIWANKFFIAEAFHLAKLREQICGGNCHVDHIVPLQSDKVCGLHVENNLQVIPARINLAKSNMRWPDMHSL